MRTSDRLWVLVLGAVILAGCTTAGEDLGGGGDDGGGVVVDPNNPDPNMVDPNNMIPTMEMKTPDAGTMTLPDSGTVASTGAVGDACTTAGMCSGAMAGCITGWPGGYCSITTCQAGTCPGGSECYELSNGTTRCLKECTTRSDCRSGYA